MRIDARHVYVGAGVGDGAALDYKLDGDCCPEREPEV